MLGGEINVFARSAYGIRINSNYYTSSLKMANGRVNVNGLGTYAIHSSNRSNRATQIDITGGEIIASQIDSATSGAVCYGIYNSTNTTYKTTSKIKIGEKGNGVSKTTPVIDSAITGIYGGEVNFYDGTIRGKISLDTIPVDVEPGYKLNISTNSENIQSATLGLIPTGEAILQINNLYFNDFQQALNACSNTDTIYLLASININKTITIEESQEVTIDLQGNNITTSSGYEISNNGKLTVIDSVGGGSCPFGDVQ